MISNPNYFVFNTNSSVGSTGPTGPTGATSTVTGPTGWTGPTGPTGITIMGQTSNAALVGNIASPYLFQYIQDGNGYLRRWDGSTWQIILASGSYNPTVNGVTLGSTGASYGWWTYTSTSPNVSGMLVMNGSFSYNGTGIVFGTPTITFPTGFNTLGIGNPHQIGIAYVRCNGADKMGHFVYLATGTTAGFRVLTYDPTLTSLQYSGSVAAYTATVPDAWKAGDNIRYAINVAGYLAI